MDVVEGVAKLRLPFAPALVGHLPRAGITLEYVGHGAVTSRLLDVDPEWNWEPAGIDENGQPVMQYDGDGNPVGLWIKLTVLGVSRYGFGSCLGSQFEAEKVLIGDAIRNAAMRFGVALDLWIKGHGEDDEQVSGKDDRVRAPRGTQASATAFDPCFLCEKPLNDGKPTVKGSDGRRAHKACVDQDENDATQPERTGDVSNRPKPAASPVQGERSEDTAMA